MTMFCSEILTDRLSDFDECEGYGMVLNVLVNGHLDSDGGYSYDWEQIGDKIAIASLDGDNETQLLSYSIEYLIEWQEAAAEMYEEENENDQGFDMVNAVHESRI
jgi:hypothetical protein